MPRTELRAPAHGNQPPWAALGEALWPSANSPSSAVLQRKTSGAPAFVWCEDAERKLLCRWQGSASAALLRVNSTRCCTARLAFPDTCQAAIKYLSIKLTAPGRKVKEGVRREQGRARNPATPSLQEACTCQRERPAWEPAARRSPQSLASATVYKHATTSKDSSGLQRWRQSV